MTEFAYWIADHVWGMCLYTMRRRSVYAFQRKTVGFSEWAWRMHLRQNRFALLYGRRILRVVFLLFFLYVCLVCAYYLATEAQERGWLSLPENVEHRLGVQEG